MRGLLGLLTLIAGVSIGAYAYYPDADGGHLRATDAVNFLVPGGHAANRVSSRDLYRNNARSFSPGPVLIRSANSVAPATPASSKIETASVNAPSTVVPKPQLVRPSNWTTVVHPAPSAAIPVNRKSMQPGDRTSRYELVLALQRELRRVGCYNGRIDGSWGVGSKLAMQAFAQRVNAALPVDNPDYILLALVRSHSALVCGRNCPDGHVRAYDGACVPRGAIVASKRTNDLQTASTVAASSIGASTGYARAPKLIAPEPTLAVRPTAVAVAQQRNSPAQIQPRGLAPLPGRMTLSGPQAERLSALETAPGVSGVPPTTRSGDYVTPRRYAPPVRAAVKKAKKKKKRVSKRRYRRKGPRNPASNPLLYH